MTLSLIFSLADNNAIGRNNDLLAYVSDDLKRFKQLTSGHPVIMGRRTFESLPKGALPNRHNIVVTHQKGYIAPGASVVHTPSEALALCESDEEVFVIGGATIYKLFLPLAHKLYVTLIHHTFPDADTFFPCIRPNEWQEVSRQGICTDDKSGYQYSFINYERAH
ncbi:dihydrofolate reductase [Breznakibacter xylanolyticus]|uniref:Dihydrofolate reductase n=1 Tax=Breznakibacter xylanolyticus TaxID=990 RepID=A0A2W7NM55_9BACT|nr:dihydrofolate reductase [Breznakibacter xylanolyticus]PZX19197.1 dihydrofolate reductase [Breznakibacter xylanolyticus]